MSGKASEKNGYPGGILYHFLLYLYPPRTIGQKPSNNENINHNYEAGSNEQVQTSIPCNSFQGSTFPHPPTQLIFLSRSPPFSPFSSSPSNKNHNPLSPTPKPKSSTLPLPPFRCFPLFSGRMSNDAKVWRRACVGEGRGCWALRED